MEVLSEMDKQVRTNLLLILTALIWGFAFVAQQVGMDYLGPFTFTSIRFFIGCIVLLPFILLMDRRNQTQEKTSWKLLVIGGICCGLPLGAATAVQQFALLTSPAGKVGFLTALYILFVPILGIFLKKKIGIQVWISVLIAVAGMYLLCINGSFSLKKGDALAIVCSIIFAIQILFVDYYSPQISGLKLACAEFLVAGIANGILMLLFESPSKESIFSAAIPLLYTGVLSSGIAYTLQIIAQKDAQPSVAALIMSLESVFSVIGAWLVLHQTMSLQETLGCILMFAAIVLAQLPMAQGAQDLQSNE